MTLGLPTLDFKSLSFAKNLKPELLGGAVALVAVGLTAAYLYYRMKKKYPKGIFHYLPIDFVCVYISIIKSAHLLGEITHLNEF